MKEWEGQKMRHRRDKIKGGTTGKGMKGSRRQKKERRGRKKLRGGKRGMKKRKRW